MKYYVYILTNIGKNVLYVGITNNLKKRVYEHIEKLVEGFTKRYNADKLVFFEAAGNVKSAIQREKQIKNGPRNKKVQLIESMNPLWDDLYYDI